MEAADAAAGVADVAVAAGVAGAPDRVALLRCDLGLGLDLWLPGRGR